jgi:hypothetical protein
MSRYPRSRTRFRFVGATVAILSVLVASTVMAVSFVMGDEREGATQHREVTQSPSPPTATHTGEPRTAAEQPGIRNGEVDADIARLRALPATATGSPLPRIDGDATQQPDLYAAEFTRRLLTQDYGKSRQAWLSWVQSESARTEEPLVVGLVPPELRDRWAVFSVTDVTDSAAPIPTAEEWARLSQKSGRTTVRLRRVSEPMAWINAVEAGRITDPGITARIVSAEVTLTTEVDGRTRRDVNSVELGLEFEGPPTRDAWGFVGAVTYTAIPLGSS